MSLRLGLSLPLRRGFHHPFSAVRHITTAPRRPLRSFPPYNGSVHQQRRNAGSFSENARKLYAKHPFQVSLAVGAMLVGIGAIAYANYIYQTYIIASFHKFPEPVAQKLRRALYYTNMDLQPQEAIKYYRQALEIANEIPMDPFSDEIIGVKIQVASLMEKVQQWHKAIEVLERVRNDNLEWLEKFGGLEHNKIRRTKVLTKTIQISVKLGGLYAEPAIWNRDMAQERLVWAVETVLQETQRRQRENVKDDDEGPWMDNSEIGAAFEELAHAYQEKDQHYLATPLFLQALSLYPTVDCHSVVLMNNLASSIAQQSPRAAREAQAYAVSRNVSERPVGPVATRESMVESAKAWAHKALERAATLKPPVRTQECDIACAVATHNLGEFAEMNKEFGEAKRRYEEAVALARAIDFEEGVAQSSARLKGLAKLVAEE